MGGKALQNTGLQLDPQALHEQIAWVWPLSTSPVPQEHQWGDVLRPGPSPFTSFFSFPSWCLFTHRFLHGLDRSCAGQKDQQLGCQLLPDPGPLSPPGGLGGGQRVPGRLDPLSMRARWCYFWTWTSRNLPGGQPWEPGPCSWFLSLAWTQKCCLAWEAIQVPRAGSCNVETFKNLYSQI